MDNALTKLFDELISNILLQSLKTVPMVLAKMASKKYGGPEKMSLFTVYFSPIDYS